MENKVKYKFTSKHELDLVIVDKDEDEFLIVIDHTKNGGYGMPVPKEQIPIIQNALSILNKMQNKEEVKCKKCNDTKRIEVNYRDCVKYEDCDCVSSDINEKVKEIFEKYFHKANEIGGVSVPQMLLNISNKYYELKKEMLSEITQLIEAERKELLAKINDYGYNLSLVRAENDILTSKLKGADETIKLLQQDSDELARNKHREKQNGTYEV